MKTNYIFILVLVSGAHTLLTHTDNSIAPLVSLTPLVSPPPAPEQVTKEKEEQFVYFNYENKDLIEIIYEIAAAMGVNVILPSGELLKIKVTLHIKDPIAINEAWRRLSQILDIAGYSLVPEGNMYKIVKNSKLISKEVLPFYTVPVEKIPETDERIRYLYYPKYLQISNDQNQDLISQVVKNSLSENGTFVVDAASNAILISDKANLIKSIMLIVADLDREAFKEDYVALTLRYTSATTIAQLFSENFFKPGADSAKYNVKAGIKPENSFFSQNIKMVPDARSNQLFILGKKQAIDKVKEFIINYIDKEPESGKSILHVYELLYLDVAQFAPVLDAIVQSNLKGGPAQSSAGEGPGGGLDRFFEGVIIKPALAQGAELQFSSNKLIIAAKNEDWIYIKKLIEELDIPQKQVIIEVLIADLSISDIKQLGNITRNPGGLDFKPGVSIQAPEVNPMVIDPTTIPPISTAGTLQQDLLYDTSTGILNPQPLLDRSGLGEPGGTVISFNDQDGRTWGILKMLENFNTNKILSHPHVIANNNKEAFILSGEKRLVPDEAVASSGGQVIPFKLIDASIEVKITPRISSTNHVNMQVEVKIQEFLPGFGNARTDRKFTTNATVKSNEILALGGLISSSELSGLQATPILSKIPILGWLFKNKRRDAEKVNLTVFISPTVILPRLRGGINEYTDDYVRLAKDYSQEAELFDGLRDPITRFFFTTTLDSDKEINKFLHASYDKENVLLTDGSGEIHPIPVSSVPPHANTQTIEPTHPIPVAPRIPESTSIKLPDNTAQYVAVVPFADKSTVIAKTDVPPVPVESVVSTQPAPINKIETRENRLRDLLKNEGNPFVKS